MDNYLENNVNDSTEEEQAIGLIESSPPEQEDNTPFYPRFYLINRPPEEWIFTPRENFDSPHLALLGLPQNPHEIEKFWNGEFFYTSCHRNSINYGRPIQIDQIIHREFAQEVFGVCYSIHPYWFAGLLSPQCSMKIYVNHNPGLVGVTKVIPISQNKFVMKAQIKYGQTLHAKFLAIKYDGFVRIVVSSGNITKRDWKDGNNMCFIQDFPESSYPPSNFNHEFIQDIHTLMSSLRIPVGEYFWLTHYIYNHIKVKLSYTIPGSNPLGQSGLHGLKHRIERLSPGYFQDSQHLTVTYLTSSLGNITPRYVNDMRLVLSPNPQNSMELQIVYPSNEQFPPEFLAQYGSGPYFHNQDNWNEVKRVLFYRLERLTLGRYSHIKLILFRHSNSNLRYDIGYVGSSNLSVPAMGQNLSGTPTYSNYELGVVFQFSDYGVPIPFNYPPQPYNATELPVFTTPPYRRQVYEPGSENEYSDEDSGHDDEF